MQFDDRDGNRLHVTWSRSWNLLVTIAPKGRSEEAEQVALDPEQAATLRDFLGRSAE
jgi:hypothetical protein